MLRKILERPFQGMTFKGGISEVTWISRKGR